MAQKVITMNRLSQLLLFFLIVVSSVLAQQMADPDFNAMVAHPAYTSSHPRLAIDEAHKNFHTKDGRFKPFADLLRSDGYEVVANTEEFTAKGLARTDVLVISNALGEEIKDEGVSGPAFSKAECEAVYEWVRNGGSLFLIADHAPFGAAASSLAERFGVNLGKGFVFDVNPEAVDGRDITSMVFSEQNHLLGKHPIVQGRNEDERLRKVIAFTGESMSVPDGATAVLRLSPSAGEVPSRDEGRRLHSDDAAKQKELRAEAAKKWPAGGRAMAIAFTVGRGRVVMNGEAGMLSAQVFREKDKDGNEKIVGRMGMNVPGTDDRQYVLNVLHWLSGALR